MAKHDLLLVGSIPMEAAEDVLLSFGANLGAHLATIPDGEVGPRAHWVSKVHYQVLALHPDIEVVRQPVLENGADRLNPRDRTDSWQFKVRPGVTRIRFGHAGWRLGYARDAVNAYFIFKSLRAEGTLPAHLRFQVSLPSVNSAVPPRIFADPGDATVVREGFEPALADEIATILRRIPARDLAIQWDCATEMQEAYGTDEDALARNLAPMARLNPAIPEDVLLGYHLCFGTLGGWPRFAPEDLGGAVRMANAFAAGSGRRVDWLHIPTLETTDDAFYAPLAGLEPRGARVYLGLIHNMASYGERLAAARNVLPEFGVAAYCGLGREDPSSVERVLADHLQAVAAA